MMTYTVIQPQDLISDTRAVLNGTSTVTDLLPMRRYQFSAGGTAIGQAGDVVVESYTVNDKLNGLFMFPNNLDGEVDAVVDVLFGPGGSEVGKEVSFDIDVTCFKVGDLVNTKTGTVQIIDLAVPDTLFETFLVSFTLPSATFLTEADAGFLGLQISMQRVAPTVPHTAELFTFASSITYAVNR